MNMRRGKVLDALNDSIGMAEVVASRIGAGGSVELAIKASADDDAAKGGEWCEWWGGPGLATLPLPGAEALFIDLNGERLVIGVKERRWQPKLSQGETALRALGPLAGLITVKPDGSILLGGPGAVDAVPLAALVATAVNLALAGHTHVCSAPTTPSGPGVVTVPVTAAAISSTSVKAR